jgi:hemolysin III
MLGIKPAVKANARRLGRTMKRPRINSPLTFARNYGRSELIADAFIHVTGLLLAVLGVIRFVLGADGRDERSLLAVGIYLLTLCFLFVMSAAYNLWPVSPIKWRLRRLDHSAIYLLIAGTYTAFLLPLERSGPLLLLLAIWLAAVGGVVLKLRYPGRLDRVSIALYLFLGWSGVLVFQQLAASFSQRTIVLIVLGGVLYSVGVIFHVWSQLRYQNARSPPLAITGRW